MSIRRRGEVVDQLAAVLILQSYMENASAAGKRRRAAKHPRPENAA